MEHYELEFLHHSVFIRVNDAESAAWAGHYISKTTGIPLVDVRPMAKSKYFPNKWKIIKDAPDDVFEPAEYELVMEMIPLHLESPVHVCVIRSMNTDTGKTTEHAYKRMSSANKKCRALLMSEEPLEITLVTDQGLCVLLNHHPYNDDPDQLGY